MADHNKFEEMLEKLVNEDRAGAEELFHEIVVEKSREIYENLLEADLEDEEVDEATDEEVDESDEEEVDEATDEEVDEASDDEETNEDFDLGEFEVEPAEADAGDDFVDDVMNGGDEGDEGDEGDDMEDGDAEDGDIEDRLVDLESELDKLRAEFEAEMGDGGDDEGDDMGDMGADDEGEEEAEEGFDLGYVESADEEVEESDEETEESSAPKSEAEQMREYVEKVSAKMGDNGANTKSPVAGKNDMGGTASNLVQGGEADSKGTGASAPKEENMGNVNVPGGKASKSMKTMPKGHGAEKKGSGESADNKKSTIGS